MSINNGFNGERLKKARIYRGWTVAELAEKIGCSRQTISMYENKGTNPLDTSTVDQLSKVLGFPSDFFFQKDKPISIGSTYFRALLTTNKKYRAEQVQKMEFVAQIYSFLSEYINFMSCPMPLIPVGMSPESAASLLRKQWGLGDRPIENIIHIVEQNGIFVTSFDTSTDDVDAFSQMIYVEDENDYRFLIGYSNNKTSAARIHFDIAHELGHICLHEWSEDIESLDKEEFRDRENEAHRFAAAFLLPETSFIQDAKNVPPTIPAYTRLKRKWKVSIAAMLRRSYSLGVITMEDYQNGMRTLQRRGLRKLEPLDDILQTATPSLLKTAVYMLLNEGVFSPQSFVEELAFSRQISLEPVEIERLLDIPGALQQAKIFNFPNLKINSNEI